MKILMYSDIHISRTSSILPLNSSNYKYTYRQNMILELGKYLVDLVDEYKPDVIINLGDTFDNHTLTSYDIDVASKFFECFRLCNIPHIVLVGNHEMINSEFNATEILNNVDNITVISEPCMANSDILLLPNVSLEQPNVKLAFIPYCNYKDILNYPEGDFLFSHIDIQGSNIRRNIVLPTGVKPEDIKSNYKLIFNGHIHKPSIMGNIVNVGSTTTHSFSDDEDSVPQCYIFDTNTLDLQTFKPLCCPLFRKFIIKNNINELYAFMESLDINYKYVLHITCPYEIKEEVKQYLDTNNLVLSSRLNVIVSNVVKDSENVLESNLVANMDINNTFKTFLDTVDLKFPKDNYLKVLEEVNE